MINALAQEIHANSKAKGFKHDSIPTMLLLAISELTEAMEADRKDRYSKNLQSAYRIAKESATVYPANFEAIIKDTFEDELADAAIRIFDIAASLNIDLEFHIRAKMNYNAGRPFKHGGKKY